MSIIKKWGIERLEIKEQVFDIQNVVSFAQWRLNATDGTNSDTIFGGCPLPSPEGEFTEFAKLTEEQVVDWVKAQLGPVQVQAYEAEIEAKITAMQNPNIEAPALPWA